MLGVDAFWVASALSRLPVFPGNPQTLTLPKRGRKEWGSTKQDLHDRIGRRGGGEIQRREPFLGTLVQVCGQKRLGVLSGRAPGLFQWVSSESPSSPSEF